MAKFVSQKRILVEEFPKEVKEWIPALLEPLNRFMDEMSRSLNRQLTLNANLAADIRTIECDGVYPLKFKWDLKERPIAIVIGQAREKSENHTVFTSPLFLDWEFTQDSMVQINSVINLAATTTNKFNLTLISFTG